MKNFFLIYVSVCVIIFISFEAYGENLLSAKTGASKSTKQKDIQKAAEVLNDTLEVTARLVEIPGKFPPNDAYNYVYVMKYRLISVVRGSYEEKELYVGHYNPLIPRKLIKDKMDNVVDGTVEEFKIGDKHQLKLVEPIEDFFDQKEDEYYDTELPKYFAVKADLLK